ncbi:hypothetical protein MTO96_015258 [Rhipicephalus appendiculatus]
MQAGTSSPPDLAPVVDKRRRKSARKKVQEKSPSLSGINSAFSDAAQPGILLQRKRKSSPAPNVQRVKTPPGEKKRRHREAKGRNSSPDPPARLKSPGDLVDVDSNVPPDKPELATPSNSPPTSLVPTFLSPATPPVAKMEKGFTSARSTPPGRADSPRPQYRQSDWNGPATPNGKDRLRLRNDHYVACMQKCI